MTKIISQFALICLVSFTSCEKDILKEDITVSSNPFTITDLGALVITDLVKLESGEYYLPYYRYNPIGKYDLGIGFFDQNGILQSNNVFESSQDVFPQSSTHDNNGNIYVVGSTNSLELKSDKTVPSNTLDGYLGKFDSKGNMLWQIGYSNILAGNRGVLTDKFNQVYIIDNKIYCTGVTQNYTPQSSTSTWWDYENWVVVFDMDGKYLTQSRYPAIYYTTPPNGLGMNNFQLKNGDILFYWIQPGLTSGTTVCLSRYSPKSNTQVWKRYYTAGSTEGDIRHIWESKDGNLWAIDLNYSSKQLIDGNSGDILSTTPLNLNPEGYNGNIHIFKINEVNNSYYITGSVSKGIIQAVNANSLSPYSTDAKPWFVKLDENLNIEYNKIYDMPGGSFLNLVENANSNLQVLLSLEKFGTKEYSTALVTLDKSGNLITP